MERRDAFHQIPDQREAEKWVEEQYYEWPEGARKVIFVVEGSTGEYSDHCEWPVVAYTDEEQAKLHVQKATERAKELMARVGDKYEWSELSGKQLNEWDRNMYVDYTGVNYRYYSVDLLDVLPPKGMPKLKGRTR